MQVSGMWIVKTPDHSNSKIFPLKVDSLVSRFHLRQVLVYVLCMSYCKYKDVNLNIKIYSGVEITCAI